MLPGGVGRRDVATVVVAVVLLASCFGTAAGSLSAGESGRPAAASAGGPSLEASSPSVVAADPTSRDSTRPDSPQADDRPGPEVVHPDLRNASGEVTVVVRFRELDQAAANASSRRERGVRMRRHAVDTQSAFEEFVAAHPGVTVDRSFWVANAKLVTVDTDAVALQTLASVDGVRKIHPNYRIEGASATAVGEADTDSAAPDAALGVGDRRYTYGLEQMRVPEVWERFGTRGGGVSVAVLDSGVDPSHPDLDVPPERWAEFDEDGDRVYSTPYDSGEHGTHTSGTVAGGDASGTQIGVAPEATLYHGKVLEGDDGTWAAVIAGIEWAATEAEVDVVSMSLGGDTYESAFVEPIRRANDLGVVVVATAGNNGEGASNSPGNSYDTIAVGAVDANRTVSDSSGGERVRTAEAWGSAAPEHWPDEYVVPNVAAPGVDVWSAEPGGEYGARSGTSMAAPHVAGVVALVRAAGGDVDSQHEMRALLERTARKPADAPAGKDTRYGAGVVDAYAATGLGTADSAVAGRVVDADGDPVPGSRVETEFGYGVDAGADGRYRLAVPSMEQTVTVEAFGYEPETVEVAPTTQTIRREVVLSTPRLAARTTSTPPTHVDPGETVTYEFAVSNVSAVTVEAGEGTTVGQGEPTVRVDGEAVALGERRTYPEPKTNEDVTVEVETTAETVAALDLAFTFDDGASSVTRETPRVHVHPDPLRVPSDYATADLQSAVDVAAPGTTLVVADHPLGRYPLSVDGDDAGVVGLSIRKPLTIRAARGSSPVLAVADPGAVDGRVVALESTARGVALRGVTVEGNGADVGVRTTRPASLRGVAVRNAAVGFELRAETRARGATLDGGAVEFDARDVAISTTATPPSLPASHERVGTAYDVAVVGDSPRVDLAVTFDADGSRLDVDSIRAWRHDGTAGGWRPVADARVDRSGNRVVATLSGAGTIAPLADRGSTAVGDQHAANASTPATEAPPGKNATASDVDDESARPGADAETTPADAGPADGRAAAPVTPTANDGAAPGVPVTLLAAVAGLLLCGRRS